MAGEVTQLKPANEEEVAPAVDVSIIEDMHGGRQVQLRTAFLQGTEAREQDRILDVIFHRLDRQKARYEIESLLDEIAEQEIALQRFEENLAVVEKEHKEKQDERGKRLEVLRKDKDDLRHEEEQKHYASGKTGTFEPRGGARGRLQAFDLDIGKIGDEIKKADEDRDANIANLETNRRRFREEIEKRQAKIAKLRERFGIEEA